MATFEITEGAPGQGKSLYTAKKAEEILTRNFKWWRKDNPKRCLYSNMKFSEAFEEKWGLVEDGGFIAYWADSSVLVHLHDVDIIWDEIATELDSRNFANLTVEMKRFLSQYRKRGLDIYANTQDFSMIDMRARLMISRVRTLRKIIGSRDISTTKPNPKHIWGLVWIRDVINFRETNPEKKRYEIMPDFMLIDREGISIYDTRQDIKVGELPPLRHETRRCEFYGQKGHETCSFVQVRHT